MASTCSSQKDTPWSDGTPGLSQRPIQPGNKFVYKFKASPPGNHWYHSHEKMSLVDGLYGAIHIRLVLPAPQDVFTCMMLSRKHVGQRETAQDCGVK